MTKLTLICCMAFLGSTVSFAQVTKTLEFEQQQRLAQRMTPENILWIADSLFADYRLQPFGVRKANGGSEHGLYYLRQLYERAVKENIRPEYAQQQADETDALSRIEAQASAELQYEKLKRVAGEYQQKGNLEKARELYLRAVAIKPGDQDAVDKLAALDKLLKEKEVKE
jgi:hypothetical protein